jgi:hypothetical protein
LDDNSIIQVDATVIAGVLILLTLSSISLGPEKKVIESIYDLYKSGLILATIAPFAFSAVLILLGNFASKPPKNYLKRAGRLAMYGFFYMVATVGFITVAPIFLEMDKFK